jgi:nitrite reductase/ring-hydroxylating ferredoxin subunit
MPDSSRTCVAVYRRSVAASLEQVWENVHDWEHLPWLHRISFSSIELLDSGSWGWRARIGLQPPTSPQILLELVRNEHENRYVARTLEGPGAGTEIWTRLSENGDCTGVEVEFHLPDIPPERADAVGAVFVELYTRLWDEDEAMMVERTARLAELGGGASTGDSLELGTLAELRRRLPLVVRIGARRFRVIADGTELAVHACVCPHRLGPLDETEVVNGRIRCPWHGYEFDLRTGRSSDGRRLSLPPAPRLELDEATGTVRLTGFPGFLGPLDGVGERR